MNKHDNSRKFAESEHHFNQTQAGIRHQAADIGGLRRHCHSAQEEKVNGLVSPAVN